MARNPMTTPAAPALLRDDARFGITSEQAVAAIGGGALVTIAGFLALSLRTSRRAERAQSVIDAAEKLLLAHRPLRANAGPALAGGSFQMATSARKAEGWYTVSLGGGVRGRAFVTATRPGGASSEWQFQTLRVELDKAALARRAAERRAMAIKAGYLKADDEGEAGGAAAAASADGTDASAGAAAAAPAAGADYEDEDSLWYAVVGPLPVETARDAAAAAGLDGPGAAAAAAEGAGGAGKEMR